MIVRIFLSSILFAFLVSPVASDSGSGEEAGGFSGDRSENIIPSNLSIEFSGDDGSGSYVYYIYQQNNLSTLQTTTSVFIKNQDDQVTTTTNVHTIQDQSSTQSINQQDTQSTVMTDNLLPLLEFTTRRDQAPTTFANYPTEQPERTEGELDFTDTTISTQQTTSTWNESGIQANDTLSVSTTIKDNVTRRDQTSTDYRTPKEPEPTGEPKFTDTSKTQQTTETTSLNSDFNTGGDQPRTETLATSYVNYSTIKESESIGHIFHTTSTDVGTNTQETTETSPSSSDFSSGRDQTSTANLAIASYSTTQQQAERTVEKDNSIDTRTTVPQITGTTSKWTENDIQNDDMLTVVTTFQDVTTRREQTTTNLVNYHTTTESLRTEEELKTTTTSTNSQNTTFIEKENELETNNNESSTNVNFVQDISLITTIDQKEDSLETASTFTVPGKENDKSKIGRKSNILLYRDTHVVVIVFSMTSEDFKEKQDFTTDLENDLLRLFQASFREDEDGTKLRYKRRLGDGKELSNRENEIEVKVVEVEVIDDKLIEVKFVVRIDEQLISANQVTDVLSGYSVGKLSEFLQLDVISLDVEKKVKEVDVETESYFMELIIVTSVFVFVFGLLISFLLWILMFNRKKKNIFPIPTNVALSECSAIQRADSHDSMRVFSCADEVPVDSHLAVKIENWLNGETEKPFKRKYCVSTKDRAVQTTMEKKRPQVKENIYLSPIKQDSFPKETQTDPYQWQWQEIKSQIESSFHTYEIPSLTPEKQEENQEILEHTYQSIPGFSLSNISAISARGTSVQEESAVKSETVEASCPSFEEFSPIEQGEKNQNVIQSTPQLERTTDKDESAVERELRRERRRQKRRNRSKRKTKVKQLDTSMEDEMRVFPKVKGAIDDRKIKKTPISSQSKVRRSSSKKEKKHKKLVQARAELDAILGGCEPEVFSPLYLNYKERNRLRWKKSDDSSLKQTIYW